MTSSKVSEGGAGLHPQGVQRGVQKWGFVRGSRGARNPKISASFCLPATGQNGHNRQYRQVMSVLHVF